MDFEKGKKTVQVLYSALRHEFDVRADGATDPTTAEEMAKGKFDNPLVTSDLVVIDGRTSALAQLYKAGMPKEDNDQVITVDILPFRYDDLNSTQKADIISYALERNYSLRFRRLSTEDDCLKSLENAIKLLPNATKSQLKEKFPYLGARFDGLYENAKNAVRQQKIAQARQLMKEDPDLNAARAAKKVGLDSPDGIIQTQGKGVRDKTFYELKQKQAALQKAVVQVKNYATYRLKLLREGRISGVTLQRLNEHDTKQALKLIKTQQDVSRRVEKELVEYIPGYHTR